MTDYPLVGIEWEPNTQGVVLELMLGMSVQRYKMNLISVRELSSDMEEANMEARGFAKHELMTEEVNEHDKIIVGGDTYTVGNVLVGMEGVVLQFKEQFSEIFFPSDHQLTVYRRIE